MGTSFDEPQTRPGFSMEDFLDHTYATVSGLVWFGYLTLVWFFFIGMFWCGGSTDSDLDYFW